MQNSCLPKITVIQVEFVLWLMHKLLLKRDFPFLILEKLKISED